ncbi:MAG TPA: peptidoglycan-binding domain-containing protein [Candidatus Rifleibacterium sp.]|nr:peptidoglycan-binding domain-containing protein [Candidatus Rifleibacterium sp.]HPT44342.1 peptidoglycan-binding domain-containing protein [Candidatus Rifleibacterium sp.]
MNRFSYSLIIVLMIAVMLQIPAGQAFAESPITAALENYSIKSTENAGATAPTAKTDVKKPKGVILNTDGLYRTASDIAFMHKFKKELISKYGINAVVSPYCCQADDHVKTIRNCPKGYWVVNAASGICAGTYRDMVIGVKNGYLKKVYKDRQIAGMIFLNLSTKYILKDVKYLVRGWDDNFSPKSFKGIPRPYDYLVSNGFYVVESPQYNKKLLDDRRVPVLAAQIAKIMLGNIDSASPADNSSGAASFKTLKRIPKNGVSDPTVVELQKALIANGFYKDCKIDGWFGPHTALAVMEFERANGIRVTGAVTEQLFKMIKSKAAGK